MKRFFVGSFIVIYLFISIPVVYASHPQTNSIYFLDSQTRVSISTQNSTGGFSLAAADLGQDGTPELVVGNGFGSEPRVRVLRQDGSEIGNFLAYTPTLGVGINVAVCDLNADGFNEIMTAPQRGGVPDVRIFDGFGTSIGNGIFVYSQTFRGGVNLACGDVMGDTRAELITLPGAGGGPHVRVWNLENGVLKLTTEFFAFDATDRSGLVGTVSNKQLIIAQQKTKYPIVKTFSLDEQKKNLDERTISIDATGIASIVIHNQERIVSTTSNGLMYNVDANTKEKISYTAESFILTSLNNQLIAIESRPAFDISDETKIIVDISQQRLYAYKDGILENSFLISSGKNNSTPLGNHRILAKIPKVHYKWSYGPNDPRNYDLGLVPYNLRIAPHIYLHYAYWHKNFGHPMSRGCVNISLEDMKWLYDWADVGMKVDVVK
jgi:lipoprotein-anchoring transpeptidase ErfK/SrfK